MTTCVTIARELWTHVAKAPKKLKNRLRKLVENGWGGRKYDMFLIA
jgi:hypothetical protein